MPVAGSYSLLAAVLGYPASVVPVTRVRTGEEGGRNKSSDVVQKTAMEAGRDSAGLPVGVQLMGRPWARRRDAGGDAGDRTGRAQGRRFSGHAKNLDVD